MINSTQNINLAKDTSNKVVDLNKSSNIEKSFSSALNALDKSFRETENKSSQLVKTLPAEYKNLFELQLSVYKCNFQTEIITKVGEALQGAVRKLQNQAG